MYVATAGGYPEFESGVYAIDSNTLETKDYYSSPNARVIAVNSSLSRLAWSQNGVRGRIETCVEMLDLPGGTVKFATKMRNDELTDLAFCGSDDWLVSSWAGIGEFSGESQICIYDSETGDRVGVEDLREEAARAIATSTNENRFAAFSPRSRTLKGWEFKVSPDGTILTPLPELDLDGVNGISFLDICSTVLWIARDNECLVYDWKTRHMQTLPLPESLTLYSIANLELGRRAIGLSSVSVYLLEKKGEVLQAQRLGPRRSWMTFVCSLPSSDVCYVFGESGEHSGRIGIVRPGMR